MTRDEEVVFLARKLRYVREAGPNSGLRVNAIQKWCNGRDGESWCVYFATMILDIAYEGKSPVRRMGSCDQLLEEARMKGWLTMRPMPGDLFLVLKTPTDAVHCGIVIAKTSETSILEVSGNSNEDGSSNGVGVFERTRLITPGKIIFVHYPRDAR